MDEERTLARLRALRGDLIDPAVAAHHGRVVKGTGDGSIVEFRSVIDATRCAIEMQNGLVERNAGVPPERRIEFRVGIHVGEVVEESDGDLMGDAVNVAARLEGIAKPGAICLSEDAYRQVKGRLEMEASDLGAIQLKNIAEPMRAYLVEVGRPGTPLRRRSALRHRRVASLATLAFLVVAGVAGWDFYRRQALNDRELAHNADGFFADGFLADGFFVRSSCRHHARHGQPADGAGAYADPTSGEVRIDQPA